MSSNNVIIDALNIQLTNGWQGDPTYLARKISEQIQQQSAQLSDQNRLDIAVQGSFCGVAKRVNEQFSDRLNQALTVRNSKMGAGATHD